MAQLSPTSRPTAWTLLCFVAMAVGLQLAPVPASWKVVPDLRETFLVQGWKEASTSPLVGGGGFAPPPAPVVDEEEEEDDAPVAAQPAPGTSSAPSQAGAVGAASPADAARAPVSAASLDAAIAPSKKVKNPLLAPHDPPLPILQPCLTGGSAPCAKLALDGFFAALARTAAREPGAVTRISHFGDSIIASDYISSTVRRRFQRQFGDAGHGFVLAGRPWRWYDHRGVRLKASEGWAVHGSVFTRFRDRLYGFGGVAFQTSKEGLTSEVATAADGAMGRKASRLELYYLQQPQGGSLDVTLNGAPQARLSTQGEQRSMVQVYEVADGPARLQLRTVGDGVVRVFGTSLERTAPGVVYDSLGMVGASTGGMLRIDPRHQAEQLKQRRPDLVILHFGANEYLNYERSGAKGLQDYERQQAQLIKRFRNALPEVSVLVMSPLDMATRGEEGLVSRPIIAKMVEAQRNAALKNGAAFWNTHEAMGGDGAMPRWVNARLGSSDLTHPSWGGAVYLGNELFRSLVAAYQEKQSGAPRLDVASASERGGVSGKPSPALERRQGSNPASSPIKSSAPLPATP